MVGTLCEEGAMVVDTTPSQVSQAAAGELLHFLVELGKEPCGCVVSMMESLLQLFANTALVTLVQQVLEMKIPMIALATLVLEVL